MTLIAPDYYCGLCARFIDADQYPSPSEPDICADCHNLQETE